MVYTGPKKINIGANKIHVILYKFPGPEYADYDPWLSEIRVSSDKMSHSVERQTILHELIHAIEKGNVAIKSLTEQQTESLASGIYDLIRQNKKLVKWIQEDE